MDTLVYRVGSNAIIFLFGCFKVAWLKHIVLGYILQLEKLKYMCEMSIKYVDMLAT